MADWAPRGRRKRLISAPHDFVKSRFAAMKLSLLGNEALVDYKNHIQLMWCCTARTHAELLQRLGSMQKQVNKYTGAGVVV